MVRLLLIESSQYNPCSFTFNPTMVRLLRMTALMFPILVNLFQSHNGAIAARLPPRCGVAFCAFNPTMVRLLHGLSGS